MSPSIRRQLLFWRHNQQDPFPERIEGPLALHHQSPKVDLATIGGDHVRLTFIRRCIYLSATGSFAVPERGSTKMLLQMRGQSRSLAVTILVREVYSSSSKFQGQFVAEFPYPHIILRKRLIAAWTNAFEIRLSPSCSSSSNGCGIQYDSHKRGTVYCELR